jgi:hypothetical protein
VLFSFPVMVGFVAAASILKNPRIRTGTGRGWRHTIEGKRPPLRCLLAAVGFLKKTQPAEAS